MINKQTKNKNKKAFATFTQTIKKEILFQTEILGKCLSPV